MKIGFIYTDSKMLNQAQQIMALCTEKGALDELGIGRIRDLFSNALFPGITSLQTRAKYFAVLPQIYEELSKTNLKNPQHARDAIRDADKALAQELVANSGEEGGIVGGTMANEPRKKVKYDATYIYWNGLQTFGIIDNPNEVAVGKFLHNASLKRKETSSIIEESAETFNVDRPWNMPILTVEELSMSRSINLTRSEAEFLMNRLSRAEKVKGSLLLELLTNDQATADVLSSIQYDELRPLIRQSKIAEVYDMSVDFANFMHGIYLRYNMLLGEINPIDSSEKTYCDEKIKVEFEKWFNTEWPFISNRMHKIWNWVDTHAMRDSSCLAFCKSIWHDLDNSNFDQLDIDIAKREEKNKGARKKIRNPEYYQFKPSHYVQYGYLQYRWPVARQVICDIQKALQE